MERFVTLCIEFCNHCELQLHVCCVDQTALVHGNCCQRNWLPHCCVALPTTTIELNVQQPLHSMPSIDPALRLQTYAFVLDKLLYLSVSRRNT